MTIFKNKRRFETYSRWFAGFMIIALFAPMIFLSLPRKAHAVVPVGQIFNIAPLDIFHTKQTFLNVTGKELGFDGIMWLIAKQLIQSITSDLISWINSGFNGAPAFVQDFKGFMLTVADQTLGSFLSGTALAFLCEPFKLRVSISIQLGFFPFDRRVACTLSDVVGNIDGFLSGNFFDGGIAGIFHMTQFPQNNVYGAYLMEQDFLALKMLQNITKEQKRMDFGHGFLSFETCSDPAPEEDPICETQTPGKVIEAQLDHLLGSGVRQLEIADEFDEIIAALMSQLLNQLLSTGLSALGNATNGGVGGTSFIGRLRTDPINQQTTAPTPEDAGFILPPLGETTGTQTSFSYTISSPGIVHVRPGELATVPITKTIQTGTAASVSLTVPSAPSIVTSFSFGNDPCTPSCTSNVIFTVSPTAAVGTYTTTVGGSPAPSNGTINITINVTNTPPADTVNPVITFGTAVGVGNGVSLIVPVTFTDNVAINSFSITFVEGGQTRTAVSSPQNFTFDVSTFSSGVPLHFTATAVDTSGNQTIATKTTDLLGDAPPGG